MRAVPAVSRAAARTPRRPFVQRTSTRAGSAWETLHGMCTRPHPPDRIEAVPIARVSASRADPAMGRVRLEPASGRGARKACGGEGEACREGTRRLQSKRVRWTVRNAPETGDPEIVR